ncbi:Type III restriction/modification enzyme methylation subunit, partial [Haemophilus influenzae]
NPCF